MRTENPKRRLQAGEYYITPESEPERSPVDNKPYWEVVGFRIWGGRKARMRLRFDIWRGADEKLRGYENGDAEWLRSNKEVATPAVIVSRKLDESRLAEAERAVALLPLDESNNLDRRWRLDDGIAFALTYGWNAIAGDATVKEVIQETRAWLKKRNALPWQNEDYLSDGSICRTKCVLNHCERIFGQFTISVINSAQSQKKVLEDARNEPDNYKQLALQGLRLVLNYLFKKETIGVVRMHRFGLKSKRIPQVMKLLERQEYLDVFWDTDLAAASVARFHLGLRPCSDLQKSRAAEKWGLTPDLRYYHVPVDSKTGYRAVEVPPVAKLLFQILKKEGRLGILNEHGNYQLHLGSKNTWSFWYLKTGYGEVTPKRAKHCTPRLRKLSDEEAVAEFNKQYPRKYKRGEPPTPGEAKTDAIMAFIEDSPRHGCISAYVHATNGMVDSAATYFGNSRGVILAHYLALIPKAEAFLQYQMIPTPVLEETDPKTIPLPSWAKPEHLTPDDKAEIEALRATLPQLDPTVPSLRAKGRAGNRDAIVRLWATRKASSDWPKTKEKYQAHLPRVSAALKAKREAKAAAGNRTQAPVPMVHAPQNPAVQSVSVPATKAA